MAFDIKELMVDITKASPEQWGCHPSILPPTCGCTYHTVMLCHPSLHTTTIVPCNLGTYTCFAGSIVTCGGPFIALVRKTPRSYSRVWTAKYWKKSRPSFKMLLRKWSSAKKNWRRRLLSPQKTGRNRLLAGPPCPYG